MIKDLVEALHHRDLWLYLAWQDIVSKYKRTTLGPFWSIAVTLVSISCMSGLGVLLFKVSLVEFLPHVACGMVVWAFLSSLIIDSCTVFISQAHIIQNAKLPVLAFIYRMFIKNLILFAHSFVIVAVVILFLAKPTIYSVLIVPAIFIFAVNTLSIGIIMGFFAARFRDVVYLIQTILSIVVLITPIMWKKEMLGDYAYIADINPFTHFIALFRDPLLGKFMPYESVLYVGVFTLVGLLFASFLYNRFKNRLVFWL